MNQQLKTRSQVPVEETWDLSHLYPTLDALSADVDRMQALSLKLEQEYKGKLCTAEAIAACLNTYQEVLILLNHTGSYAMLAVEVDHYNSENMNRASKISTLSAEIASRLSFIESEIVLQPTEVIHGAMELFPPAKNYLAELLREAPHRLHPEAERALAAMNPALQAPYDVYNALKLADMVFPSFEAEGKTWPLGYSLFEDNYEFDPNTAVRRAAFDAFHQKIREYENGTAAAYNAYVQNEKLLAGLRGFPNLFAKDLFQDHITEEMYHRQIDTILEKLSPHMRRYVRLLKKVYHLDRLTYADLKMPLDPTYTPELTIPASRKYVEDGLAILGDEYQKMVRQAYEERWFDFAQNQGKCTGGFCDSPYRKNSYILLSWCGRMSDVFTIAHELGHAGHFRLCGEAQSIFDTQVPSYFVEAPSTMNELLMAHHLLKTSNDKRFRRWVLASMVSDTYYHNFVTHLLEAAFQRQVYRLVQEGGSVQAETMNSLMLETLKRFWGDDVELIPGAELTWMRQPHYYMGLYSYSYSAGLTIATKMCKRIEKEGIPAVEDWKKVLSAGSTLPPVELAAMGGIDITTNAALEDTIATIGGYVDEICRLTEELGPLD